TGDSALRLAHWFGDTPQFWMSLQVQSDLQQAEAESGQAIRALPTGPTVREHKAYKQVKSRIGKDL
ncbi:addiction module antidote protein, HigA family, partial [Pseudomonas aeruginosa]